MFTGIVEELGEIVSKDQLADAARFVIRGPLVTTDAGHGDSIAVNGVCLTVIAFDASSFQADASTETLGLTTLGRLAPGAALNLERAMLAGGRFGGWSERVIKTLLKPPQAARRVLTRRVA